MAAGEDDAEARIAREPDVTGSYLHDFRLYETRSKFYMVGQDKSSTLWRVLKIDRLDSSELNIRQDSTTYSECECQDLLNRIDEGNKSTGGLKFVTNCYGIVGFVKFLGPYYMLLITERKQIGAICGHAVYAITKSEMIALPNPAMPSIMANSKKENRYKKLLGTVDLTKDFFFSYSYPVMRSLQNNLCDRQAGQVLYETMFVWNEFLTRGIRNHLKNTLWTVALVYGFFKQAKLSISGKDFHLTLIARRSRDYAGTRYLKRGVNENGRVANDVETEQIVFEDIPGENPTQISSVVQNRGSIPLFWSQETSKLNLKPDIILQKKDKNYEATRLHFENLAKRYGNPIIILNLIKSREKKPRESILREEFANAIDVINKDLSEENRLKFLHWDLHKHSRSKATNVLIWLGKVAAYALTLTGFFYYQVTPALGLEDALRLPVMAPCNDDHWSCNGLDNDNDSIDSAEFSGNGFQEDYAANSETYELGTARDNIGNNEMCFVRPPMFQKGVLRTNCIDCLDRTNVAQYAYGLAALGHQLHALGFLNGPKIDLGAPLADELMSFYETMGDTLALQYGGSAAHNKIFSERRGQWKAATQSQEFFRTLQRYYSNAYMDAEKQNAINLFLGDLQPQEGKPVPQELDSFSDENARSSMKRSLSDGNILRDCNSPASSCNVGRRKLPNSALSDRMRQVRDGKRLSDSTPEILTCASDASYSSRYTPTMSCRQLFAENEYCFFSEGDSNFLDFDGLSSSGNSCEEEIPERSKILNSPIENRSTENVNGIASEAVPPLSGNGSGIKGEMLPKMAYDAATNSDLNEFSESFVQWVIHGEALCH